MFKKLLALSALFLVASHAQAPKDKKGSPKGSPSSPASRRSPSSLGDVSLFALPEAAATSSPKVDLGKLARNAKSARDAGKIDKARAIEAEIAAARAARKAN